jgi:hypothetical protein
VGLSGEYFDKGRAVVETGIQKKQIAFLEAFNEFLDERMFRCCGLAINKAQRRAADQVEEAAEFSGDWSQSLLAFVPAEDLPERFRFRQCEGCFIGSQSAQAMPAVAIGLAGCLQF